MPLFLILLPSFKKSLRKIGYNEKLIVSKILEALKIYYAFNCDLAEAKKIAPRFFYKQLRKPYYEAGVERNVRIVIKREKSECFAVLSGNHDETKQFLAKN